MNCYLHSDREATAYCRTCGRPLCADDQREIYGVVYCQECLARQLGQPVPASASGYAAAAPTAAAYSPSALPPGAPQGHVPTPGLALLLGFIPGVGAVYNGQYLKAFLQVVIFAFLISMANWASSDAAGVFFGLGIAAFYFYMLLDSYRSAKAMQAGQPVNDFFGFGQSARQINAPIAAIVLIAIGAIFLLHSLGFFYLDVSRYIWPAALIALGIFLLLRQKGTSAP